MFPFLMVMILIPSYLYQITDQMVNTLLIAGSTIIFADQELNRTTAQSSVTAGVVTSITVVNDGFGYSQDNPPSVLIESPLVKKEKIDSIKARVILELLLVFKHLLLVHQESAQLLQ